MPLLTFSPPHCLLPPLHILALLLRPIAEGVVVGFYTGEVLSIADLDDRYPDFEGSEYVMQVGPDRYLDARDPDQSGITRRDVWDFQQCWYST